MRDIFFAEIKKAADSIKLFERGENGQMKYELRELVFNTMNKIMDISRDVNANGAEEINYHLAEMLDEGDYKYLRKMLLLAMDGASGETIEEIGFARFYSGDFSDYEALMYLMSMYGVNAIVNKEKAGVVSKMLISMLPEEFVSFYEKYNHNLKEKARRNFLDLSVIRRFYIGEVKTTGDEETDKLICHMDSFICARHDREIQQFLAHQEVETIVTLMGVLSTAARSKLFMNMSERMAVFIAEELDERKPESEAEIVQQLSLVNKWWRWMLRAGECYFSDPIEPGDLCLTEELLRDLHQFS